ncbi:MAG: hypothetical protein CMI13_00035 [Oleibacter sp.]|nr:hypothetical protein [Thalassolituus sp.]
MQRSATPLSFLLVLMLSLLSVPAAASAILLNGGNAYHRVAPEQMDYLFGYQDLSAEAVFASGSELPWQTATSLLLDPAVSDDAAWVRIRLHNPTQQNMQRLLEIQWVNLDQVQLYQRDNQAYASPSQSGGAVSAPSVSSSGPAANGVSLNAPAFLFPVEARAEQTTDVLLRISTHHMYLLPIYLWQDEAFERYKLGYYSLYGVFFGALLAMLFYNLFLWIFIRDRNYLLYCIYLATTFGYILAATGIGKQLLWSDSAWLQHSAYALFAAIVFFSASVFITSFLRLWQRERWMLYLAVLTGGYWLIEIIAHLTGMAWSPEITNVCALLTSFFALAITIRLALQGDRIAITFAVAWFFLIGSTIILMLMIMSVVPQNFVTQHIQTVGFLLEAILISIALAQRINRERYLRGRAQQELLALQSRTNRELEQKVRERTDALENLTKQLSHSNDELQQLSMTDALTELQNRRCFDVVLQQEITRSRVKTSPFALILADIDHFKQFNDSHGHVAGDECLRRVAQVFRAHTRVNTDCAARYGGEEFAIILPGMSEDEARQKAEVIRQAVADLDIRIHQQTHKVTISMGVTSLIADERLQPDQLTAMADQALYQAKQAGRNRGNVYARED